MINIDDVKNTVLSISSFDENEAEKYLPIIKCASAVVSSMLDDEKLCTDSRIIYLAAAKANYDIMLASSCGDCVTSFTAGDVSINQSPVSADNAKELLDNARLNCAGLIKDNGFAFLGV